MTKSSTTKLMNIERLLEKLEAPLTEAERDEIANTLLGAFHEGYSLDGLRPLLRSANEEAVMSASWIASELGAKAIPLLPEITHLLHHPSSQARFDAIDCMITCASDRDGRSIADVVRLLEDPETSVRWKVLDFLTRANERTLRAALPHLEAGPGSNVEWLLSPKAQQSAEVEAGLNTTGSEQLFAVVAAARMAGRDLGPLTQARSSTDGYIRRFVELNLQEALDS